jgi:hypothetical protein
MQKHKHTTEIVRDVLNSDVRITFVKEAGKPPSSKIVIHSIHQADPKMENTQHVKQRLTLSSHFEQYFKHLLQGNQG